MNRIVRSPAKRILILGSTGDSGGRLSEAVASDGLLIVMEPDPVRAEEARKHFHRIGLSDRATVIAGDPTRMLYKLAGPFDVILCAEEYLPLREHLAGLLSPDGLLVEGSDPMTKNVIGSDPISEALERIRTLDPSLNAFITVLDESARAQARTLTDELRRGRSRGPLHGRPISLKDIIDVEGVPTTAASRTRNGHVARADAVVVSRLRDAGAIIIGKCNLHEFALGTTSDESAFGPVHNPHDVTRSPGGSSGGSAAAVAAGMGWASIGTDTGGSIRIPAAACGVVGLKPAFGEISTVGVLPLSVSLDHVGPIARTVSDAWDVYTALTGASAEAKSMTPLSGVRLGRLDGYFLELLDPEVRSRFDEATGRLKAAGVVVVDVDIAHAADISSTYIKITLPEAAAFHARALETAPEKFTDGVRARLEMGRNIPAEDYVGAQRVRATLRAEVDAALSKCDALVLPTLPIPAPRIGATHVIVGSREEPVRSLMLRLTQLFNLTGHPAITMPCGNTDDGLPCGFQLAGRRQGTLDLLGLALSCESRVAPYTL
jgi:aspartyl-tRNA(Asn)/glutamyl-tRNA(Gln) amidotransferase subunit A